MADQPLVSGIIIFLNAERFIEEALESVFAQTYPHWELLLVDDGSTDGSTSIARRYADAHPDRIRYLEHPEHVNRGMSASRNLGIRHARGTYVAFLDSDDVWLPDKLAHQVPLLEACPEAGMLMGASLYWHSWTGRPEDAGRDRVVRVGAEQDRLVSPPKLSTTLYPLGAGAAPCVASLLIRRELLSSVGGFEERFRGVHQLYEDQAFLAKAYLKAPVFVTSLCTDRYRQHETSCVSTVMMSGRYHEVRQDFLTWLKEYLEAAGEARGEVAQVLEVALAHCQHPVRFFLVALRRKPVAVASRLAKHAARRLLPSRVIDMMVGQRPGLSTRSPLAGEVRPDDV